MSTCRSLVVVILVSALCTVQPVAAKAPRPGCRACLVVDDQGRYLFERAPDARLPNASTTKMVTALVALRELDPTDVVRVPGAAGAVGGGTLDLRPGDRYLVRDLLVAMMLESSNDAAITLAEAVSGSEEAFVAEMNAFVGDLGLTDTAFATSHGLDEPGHYSSARDLAALGRLVLDDPVLAEIVAEPRATISTPAGRLRLENRNLLLESYPGAVGVKTGYTLNAGYVLVAAARRSGRTLIAVVMGSADSFADAAALLDRGFARLGRAVVAEEGAAAGVLVFGSAGSVPVGLGSRVRGPFRTEDITFEVTATPGLSLPVEQGQSVGMIELMVDGRTVRSVEARALGSVPEPHTSWGTGFFSGLLRLFEPVARVL